MARLIILLSFLPFGVAAQPVQWAEKLRAYYETHIPVKLHLWFNQPMYAAGDTAFFRVAFLSAEEGAPIKGFNLVEVEVADEHGRVVLQQVVRIRDGWGGNQIIIPEHLPPGNYRVVAYDNWMKNFDRSRHFMGELRIAGEYLFSAGFSPETLSCYPEGGRLVAGLRNKVVVYYRPNSQGIVTRANGVQVAEFSTDRNGYGMFYFTPEAGVDYRVKIGERATQLTADADGLTILLTPSTSAKAPHRFLIQAPQLSPLRSETLTLLVSGHGSVYYSALFTFNNNEFVNLVIPSAILPRGICYVTINRSNGETLLSRIFFNQKNQCNAIVQLNTKQYATRSEVNVGVALNGENEKPLLARMSVSVYKRDLFSDSANPSDRTDWYLLLASDLHQPPPVGFDADLNTAEGLLLLDRMLISRNWPWYTWEKVLNKQGQPRFLFRDYLQLTGRLVEESSGKPFADSVNITFFVTGTQDVYDVFSTREGTFSVSFLFPFYNREEIFYRVEKSGRRIENVRLELTENINRYEAWPAKRTVAGNPYYTYAQKRKSVNTSFSYFSRGAKITGEEPGRKKVIEKELFVPDAEVDLDDYTIFPTMQETLHEIVPYLQYRKIGGRDVVRLYLPDTARTGIENPAFFIDGVLTDDPSFFLKLKPVEVDKIKLVYTSFKLEKLGAISRNGVVIVETKIQDNARNVSAAARSVKVNGITPALPATKDISAWQKINPRAPRLKSCLVWIPQLRSDDTGKAYFSFNTGDDTGRYVIRVEGVTTEGVPFVKEEYFDVAYTVH